LHFIVQTVTEKFPDITNFDSELTFIDKAAMVSLENVQFDMNELDKGMKNTRKEYEIRLESKVYLHIIYIFFEKMSDIKFSHFSTRRLTIKF
jgi:hypothetical protein